MAIAVSPPTAGRLVVQKITDYHLHLVAAHDTLAPCGTPGAAADLKGARIIGYIPDMIFDAELDYLDELGLDRVALASNSVPVQLRFAETGAGLCVAHDFALPAHPSLTKVMTDRIALTRSFYLVRHQGDQRSDRLNRIARQVVDGIRAEVHRLEALT
jgi:DNA-binding transcriptional LysR family regulator